MNRLIKFAVCAAGLALLSEAARAQVNFWGNPGDLILGFTGGTAGNDYVVDLGAPLLTPGAHTDLSANLTSAGLSGAGFASIVGANAGVVSGDLGAGGPVFVYTSTAHGATPTPTGNGGQIAAGSSIVSGLPLNANLTAAIAASSGSGNSWSEIIAQSASAGGTSVPGNFTFQMGQNPMSTFTGTTLLEDIWSSTSTPGAYTLLGTLTLNLSGASPVVGFDAAGAVPEPGTCGLIAGAGLLLFSLRRQFTRKKA
jgi:hypothetical protein